MATRGIKTRHRHLMRDLLRVLPHGKRGSKIATNGEQGLGELLQLCEESDCSEALLLDARDPAGRLYLWAATCPEGPSVLFRVVNVHTVAELKLEARRAHRARNVLIFDRAFGWRLAELSACGLQALLAPGRAFGCSSERRVVRALLTRIFSVDPSVEPGRALHAITFLWLDGRVWLRVYRIQYADDGTVLDVAEIGPRTVLCPVRIIASGFGGAILHEPR